MLIVFDLDGTLVDSAADIARSANELVTSLGGSAVDIADVMLMVGDGAGVLVKRVLERGGVDPDTPNALPRFLEIYDRHLTESTSPYPGVRETLALLGRKARLVVLTNKPIAHSDRLLVTLGLREFFDEVVGGDSASAKKPNPVELLRLMAAAPASVALLVGDSPVDCETARGAGCAFVWARYGFGAGRFGDTVPDTPYVIDEPKDLIAIADRFAAVSSGA
ncbi:MAG TPA: HAD hydrolase-like protein [Vicinamibacterales bacterium]|nr:HAD hydrolase-like protein [Vicinamibacterales bacterium]